MEGGNRWQYSAVSAALGAPLCPSMRMGWARCQDGKVLVEKREWTRAM